MGAVPASRAAGARSYRTSFVAVLAGRLLHFALVAIAGFGIEAIPP